MEKFNCYVSGKNGWVNVKKINTYEEYLRICDDYFKAKYKLSSFKIVLNFDLEQIIIDNFILSDSNFNLFKEYGLWDEMTRDAFNAYLDYHRGAIEIRKLCLFKNDFICEYENREDFATEYASQVDFIENWDKIEDYFDIEKYTDELFEDFTDIKHPTKNSIFVFRKR